METRGSQVLSAVATTDLVSVPELQAHVTSSPVIMITCLIDIVRA